MERFQYMLPTLFGLEGVAAQECKRLGLQNVRGEDGRVLCEGAPADLARLNLNVRTAERVVLVLGRFPARDFEELFQGVSSIPWEDYIPRDGAFPVRCQCVDSTLHAAVTCSNMVKKAVAQRLGGKYGLSQLPETGAVYAIRCLILKDVLTIGLDSSGPSLHKRGYRAQGVAAPLRETLAAGMVLLSRYRGRDPFVDPFCGSGTIAIEAALIAKNRAPGLNRGFPAQKWAFLPRESWLEAPQEAMDKEYHGSYEILGSDIDPAAVELAQANAALAEVEDTVRFQMADARQFAPQGDGGRVVTNPPYGERLLEKRDAEGLYRDFGRAFGRLGPGWELYLLSSHTEFERAFGRPAPKRRKLYNGPLLCTLYQYTGRAGG